MIIFTVLKYEQTGQHERFLGVDSVHENIKSIKNMYKFIPKLSTIKSGDLFYGHIGEYIVIKSYKLLY